MMMKSKQSLNNIPKLKPMSENIDSIWIKKLRPDYRRLDLIDTERKWQKTYLNKTFSIPTVMKNDWWVDTWLELVNYVKFSARWWPTPIISWDMENLFQSYNLPSPSENPNIDQYNSKLIPVIYDWFDTITIKQAGIYKIWFHYDVTILDNIQAIEFKVISNINWVVLTDRIWASWKTINIPWTITSWTDSLWWSISWTTMSHYTFNDLSDLLSVYSWNWTKNLYLMENETLQFIITITTSWTPNWVISLANIFLSYLRPNR